MDSVHDPLSGVCPMEMDYCIESRTHECVKRSAIQASREPKGFKPRRYIVWSISVHGATPTLMTRVQCTEQVNDFSTTNFADHDAVGAHTQRCAHKVAHRDRARTFNVG